MSICCDLYSALPSTVDTHLRTPQAICRYIRGDLDLKPPSTLHISDAWHVMVGLCEKLRLNRAMNGTTIEVDCAVGCIAISNAAVAEVAPRLSVARPAFVLQSLDSIDYADLYHGDRWAAEKEQAFEVFRQMTAFYQDCHSNGYWIYIVMA